MITQTHCAAIHSSLERLTCPPIELVECFYDTLFDMAPEVEPFFRGDMMKQYEKLQDMLMLVTHSLSNLSALVVAVEDLGKRHVGYGAAEAHYEVVGAALLQALEQKVADWSEEDSDAWGTLYGYLSDLMISGAREITLAEDQVAKSA